MKGKRAMKKRAPTQAKLKLAKSPPSLPGVGVNEDLLAFFTASSSSLLSSEALAAAIRAEARVGVASGFGALTADAAALGAATSFGEVLAGELLFGLRPGDLPRLRLREGVAFRSRGFTSFLTSLALRVKTVPSSKVTSYSLSVSRTKETLALKKRFVPGHLQ